MPQFCLIPELADRFKQGLINGEVNPAALAEMSSIERRDFLSKYVGDNNAQKVNALFESKLLLKNQQRGMVNWAERVLKGDELRFNSMVEKINRLDKVLDPIDQQSFLADLVNQRLKLDVSYDEAKEISNLSKKVEATKQALEEGGNRMDYGRAVVSLNNYVNDLKLKAGKIDVKKAPIKAAKQAITNIGGTAKSIKAALDNSAIFRQGWKTMFSEPGIWMKNTVKSFGDIINTFGGKNVLDEMNADIVSRPNYDLMRKAKLAVGNVEEAFPSTLPEKIPGLGRAFKASDAAYSGFLQRSRADIFDKWIDIAKNTGVELSNKELASMGQVINSLTGRGSLGRYEGSAADAFNNLFFSPRNFMSKIDIVTQPILGRSALGGEITPFARKMAAKNLVQMLIGGAAILGTAYAMDPDTVEWDPRSADFGKIKINNTRFDVTGGNTDIARLMSRIITNKSKSSTTGEIYGLNTGEYGAPTSWDQVIDFFSNKLSPTASVVKDMLKGETFEGEKPTAQTTLKSLFMPLPISNAMDVMKDNESANNLLVMIADSLGIGTQTYKDTQDKIDKEVKLELKTENDKVSNIVNQVSGLSKEERKKVLNDMYARDEITEEMVPKIKSSLTDYDKKQSLTEEEYNLTKMSSRERAKRIVAKAEGMAEEEKRKYFNELYAKGVITDSTVKYIKKELGWE